jgi:cell division protein FtsZ
MGVRQFVEKPSERTKEIDEELRTILESRKTQIKVVGAGGAGNNTITRLMQVGIVGAETIAINTDAQDLLYTDADKKILIGKELTSGLGAGGDPKVGMEAARESKEDIKKALQGADMVFLTCGLGGGCLRGSSLIYTNPDGPQRIDSIKPGSFVYSLEDGRLVKKKVIASMKTGIKKVLEVKTNNHTLYASYDHPFLKVIPEKVDKYGRFSKFKFEWTPAEKLKQNDIVVVMRKAPDVDIQCQFEDEFHQLDKSLEKTRQGKGIGFLCGYRGPTNSEFFKNFGFAKIKSIKEVGNEEVYDITVEGSHNFVAEGFVVHNTGTGSLPVVAEIAQKLGILTIAVVTLPFSMEGKQRMANAREGLENLEDHVDTMIVIPNDKLLEVVPDVSLATAFKICDEVLVNAVKGIAELVTKPGLVNLDFADVRSIMKNGGLAMIGMGESDTENRAIEAVERALNNPLITVDVNGATGALINVIGGPDITIREAQQIVEAVSTRLSPDAKIIWGAQIAKELGETLRAMLVITGVKSPQIFGPSKKWTKEERKDIEKILGIDFVE